MHHRKERRPRLHEMDRLDTRSIRSCVQSQAPFIVWKTEAGPLRLDLLWQERKGGTFGPGSAAYANYLRRCIKTPIERDAVARIGDPNDRGRKSAWVLYFSCPTCSRRCRVLYSRKGKREFGCVKCNRPAYPSNAWPYTGRRNARSISLMGREMLRHQQIAAKLEKKIRQAKKGDRFNNLRRSQILHHQYSLLIAIRMQLASSKKN